LPIWCSCGGNELAAIENTQQIEALVRAGHLLDRSALDATLATAAARIQNQNPWFNR
jgi:hypothetical protein